MVEHVEKNTELYRANINTLFCHKSRQWPNELVAGTSVTEADRRWRAVPDPFNG